MAAVRGRNPPPWPIVVLFHLVIHPNLMRLIQIHLQLAFDYKQVAMTCAVGRINRIAYTEEIQVQHHFLTLFQFMRTLTFFLPAWKM